MSTFIHRHLQNSVVIFTHEVEDYKQIDTIDYQGVPVDVYNVGIRTVDRTLVYVLRYYSMGRACVSFVEACARIDEMQSFIDYQQYLDREVTSEVAGD